MMKNINPLVRKWELEAKQLRESEGTLSTAKTPPAIVAAERLEECAQELLDFLGYEREELC